MTHSTWTLTFPPTQVYVKALDKEDHLVPVAFLDVPPYITSIKVFKNLILLGDIVKGVWLAVFQVSIIRADTRSARTEYRVLVDRKLRSGWTLSPKTFTMCRSLPLTFWRLRV
jgi:hypothetical protein